MARTRGGIRAALPSAAVRITPGRAAERYVTPEGRPVAFGTADYRPLRVPLAGEFAAFVLLKDDREGPGRAPRSWPPLPCAPPGSGAASSEYE